MKEALHISFHDGCLADVDYLFAGKDIKIKKIKIERKISSDFDITREKAFSIAPYLRGIIGDYKNVIFSDTAPLARALSVCPDLFDGKKTFHYICNRFNYGVSDIKRYNQDFKTLLERKDSIFSVYTPYENYYIKKYGINIELPVIRPTGLGINNVIKSEHMSSDFSGNNYGLLMPYLNEKIFSKKITHDSLYFGKYKGASELNKFNFFIHFPYAFSNYFLFELLRVGKPIYIPTISLIIKLLKSKKINYHFQDLPRRKRYLIGNTKLVEIIKLSEWYSNEYSSFLTYFESIDHLNRLIKVESHNNPMRNNYIEPVDSYIDNIYSFFE